MIDLSFVSGVCVCVYICIIRKILVINEIYNHNYKRLIKFNYIEHYFRKSRTKIIFAKLDCIYNNQKIYTRY